MSFFINPYRFVAEYTAQGANFDGTNDWLNRNADLSGNADSKLWTGSLWFKQVTTTGQRDILYGADVDAVPTGYFVFSLGGGVIQINAKDSTNSEILQIKSSAVTGTAWHHLLWSVDMANASNRHIYIDDVSDLSVTTYTNAAIDFTQLDHAVGAFITGPNKWNGDLADVWVDHGRYIDFSVEANRRKFRTAGGCPVDLGSDGSTPFGTAPIMYFSGATDDWHTNKGTGGGFTENGALTDAATNPCE